MKASEFDKRFDAGEDIDEFIDWSRSHRPNRQVRRVNVDFPAWMVTALDRQARERGITRQALIKSWLADRIGLILQERRESVSDLLR